MKENSNLPNPYTQKISETFHTHNSGVISEEMSKKQRKEEESAMKYIAELLNNVVNGILVQLIFTLVRHILDRRNDHRNG